MQHKVIQIGVVGAMQRAHPALTQLWLQWTGVAGLEWATFDMVRPEYGSNPATQVKLKATRGVTETWQTFCDLLSLPEKAPERQRMPIYLDARAPAHPAFWAALRRRELEEVDGPIEFWWRLLVLRYKSIQLASQILIREAIGEDQLLDRGIVGFNNPSLNREGRSSDKLLVAGTYSQPTHVVVSLRVKRTAKQQGLVFSFEDSNFKARFVSKLIDLAVSRG